MNHIRKAVLFLLLLAMILASTACSSDSATKSKIRRNSSRSDSINDPFSFMDADQSDTSPHVPEDMYQSYILWNKDSYSDIQSDILIEVDFDYDVTHIPNESLHQETVQIDYSYRSVCGYKYSSKSYTYQYHMSDDIWEEIGNETIVESTFELNTNTFPRHWEGSRSDLVYTLDILDFDAESKTMTISYMIDETDCWGWDYHMEGTQTIAYSQVGSHYYYAELTDQQKHFIYMDIDGLEYH